MVPRRQDSRSALAALLLAAAACGPAFEPKQARFDPAACEAAATLGDGAWEIVPEPVLRRGPEGAWDAVDVLNPSVAVVDGLLYNLYSGFDGRTWSTGLATSPDGRSWTKHETNPVIRPDQDWEGDYIAANGAAIRDGERFLYWYQTGERGRTVIASAESPDAVAWRKRSRPALEPGPRGSWDETALGDPYAIACDDAFYLFYLGQNRFGVQRLGVARSTDGEHWQKSHLNPLLEPGGAGAFDERGLGEPAVIAVPGGFEMIYVGRDAEERRRLGWAISADGVSWRKAPERGLIEGESDWNRAVFCDPTLAVVNGRLAMWFGGGDVRSPDENLNGNIGFAARQ